MLGPASARLRTPAAILETATRVLAENPDASMNDIAVAAGVGRATVYRYFASRDALVTSLAEASMIELGALLRDAALDLVSVPVALRRLLRALFAVADRYVVLAGDRAIRRTVANEEATLGVTVPIDTLFQRGADDGTFRSDVDAARLHTLFGHLVEGAIAAGLPRTMGREQAAEFVASLFLDGARRDHDTDRPDDLGSATTRSRPSEDPVAGRQR